MQKTCVDFKELLLYFEKIYSESENNRKQFMIHKQQCESKKCCSAELLNRVVETKDNIIQSIAYHLSELRRTKNLNIIEEMFKVINGNSHFKCSPQVSGINEKINVTSPPKSKELMKQDFSISHSDGDILGTTLRSTSPIIQYKKSKNNYDLYDAREKTKCPDNWVTPEKKSLKLVIPSGRKGTRGGEDKARQTRLSYVKLTQSSVVDLTCLPEFNGGSRSSRSECSGSPQPLVIKKELIDNDDTIMPSPTSGSNDFPILKPSKKLIRVKREKENVANKLDSQENKKEDCLERPLEESRTFYNNLNKDGRIVKAKASVNNDVANCEDSISILPLCSPSKRPLKVNKNVTNRDMEGCMASSVPVLRIEHTTTKITEMQNSKKTPPELPGPLYKEPTVRKKSEKRALPGWICEECKNFYGELYENDPLMLAKMINECSKHRGRRAPGRPSTPPNFWNPRWDVPQDTAEFNRMNDAT